ncbi:MAG: diacylglycerol kinase family lipid kinase [Bacteroidaceae bacterium]|nr:diacylglycerol kinase family lipid kinase [Bacteroidaceae bacterium]
MDKKRVLFIVNPISGGKKKVSILKEIEKEIDSTLFSYEVKLTEYAGHAESLAKNAAEAQVDIVVAVGGDGTVNEVARSLVHSNSALGIIPCGSGNGLARHLQIPMDIKKALQIINKATIHCLDYGKINGMPFFCTCGVGFDAFVSLKFAESGKRGPLSYVENTLREGIKYKPDTYTIETEEGITEHKAFLIACANASQYGNNVFIAPHASMKDGLMDVIIMESFNTIESPQIILQLLNKTIESNSHVKVLQAQKVRITRSKEGVAHCDGDFFMTGTSIDVELIQKSFNVVVNPQAKSKQKSFVQSFAEYFNEWVDLPNGIIKTKEDLMRINKNILEKIKNI